MRMRELFYSCSLTYRRVLKISLFISTPSLHYSILFISASLEFNLWYICLPDHDLSFHKMSEWTADSNQALHLCLGMYLVAKELQCKALSTRC